MARGRFVIAVLVAAGLVVAAPFISQFRNYLRGAFPAHFILILGAIVGASVALAVAGALLAVRDRRPLRYGLIVAALVIGTAYSLLTSSPDPHVAAVERFHFVQYGLIALLFYRAWRPLGDAGVLILPVLAAMLTATVEEWFQWFVPGRVGVMADVFLNWVAIGCGLLFSVGLDPFDAGPPPGGGVRPRPAFTIGSRSLRHCGTAAALFVIVFGLFFDTVHLGHRIANERIGAFTSIYTEPELHALAADRAARWRVNPPVDKTRLAREDQYRTEGIQHVQARNEAWERGEIATAWRENLILETYYAPVLERGHRWPPEQHADAAARGMQASSGNFESGAYPYAVFTWPAPVFWTVAIALAGALVLLGWRAAARRERGVELV